MAGEHFAYNRLGRQKKGPRYNPFKRGPRDPHQHKISHGYWELNPNSTDKSNRYRWVHSQEHLNPHIPTPGGDVFDDIGDWVEDVVGAAAEGFAAGQGVKSPVPSNPQNPGVPVETGTPVVPLVLAGLALVYLIK